MRNEESHFSVNPTDLDIGRSRFSRPFNHKTTFNVGQLIPFYWSEILPGDTVSMNTSKVIRMSTLLDPVMDSLYLDTYYFFVPMRLTWEHCKEFFGENTSGAWAPSTSYTIPQIKVPSGAVSGVAVGSIADYMGVPTGVKNISFSALPIRAYCRVFDEWFRDQMTMAPPNIYYGDSDQNFDPDLSVRGGTPFLASKLHDYFSSSTPAPQRGPSVSLPISGSLSVTFPSLSAPVIASGNPHSMGAVVRFGNYGDGNDRLKASSGAINGYRSLALGASTLSDYDSVFHSNLYADLSSGASGTFVTDSNLDVNALRLAFQMQKWYEKSALYGGRYIEMLKAQFGVTSPDARLQRSEYLGGNRIPINVSQVENTNAAAEIPLGHLGAYSATSDSNDDFTHSFTEHGFLIGVCVARYKHSYPQGLERAWSRKTMFDYYFPVFANIGNQAVLKKEIYLSGATSDDSVWGYQEAWADYRYHPDRTSAFMRPNVTGSLASWHYADNYSTVPTLSEDWMKEDKSMVDRTLAVTSSQAPQLIADILCDATFVRAMPLYSVPGLIDHH